MINAIANVQRIPGIERGTEPSDLATTSEVFESLLCRKVYGCSSSTAKLANTGFHSFVGAVHLAYSEHRPLVLSPDMFWLLITQGLARHIEFNAEKLRGKFVDHGGKKRITVERHDFSPDPAENPWHEAISEFSEKIAEQIGETNHSNLVANFSTTGPTERIANEIVLMDSMKSYFDYRLMTLCGIPEVTLEGVPEDWRKLCSLTEKIGGNYECQTWTDRISKTLERIASNAAGDSEPELWRDIYKLEFASGGPYLSGWLLHFFPYLETKKLFDPRTNDLLKDEDMDDYYEDMDAFEWRRVTVPNWAMDGYEDFSGPTTSNIPNGLSHAPFIWELFGKEIPMLFAAGFAGFSEDAETLAVRPNIGWAVSDGVECSDLQPKNPYDFDEDED